MAITSPALTLAIPAAFGLIKPVVDGLRRLGFIDFSKGTPPIAVKPGATIKVPISTISAALAFNSESNNYFTGGDTEWASFIATHYLRGFDISGEDVDKGSNAPRMKTLFFERAGRSIAAAVQGAVRTGLDRTTASTAVKLAAAPTLEAYTGLADSISWLNKAESVLAVNGAELGVIKGLFTGGAVPTKEQMAEWLGFGDIVLVPGMTARACIVPFGSVGFLARVPEIVADYPQAGVETDPETGLSIGFVVANDQAHNRKIVNADLWFGTAVQSASPNATTTQGVIKVGTAA